MFMAWIKIYEIPECSEIYLPRRADFLRVVILQTCEPEIHTEHGRCLFKNKTFNVLRMAGKKTESPCTGVEVKKHGVGP